MFRLFFFLASMLPLFCWFVHKSDFVLMHFYHSFCSSEHVCVSFATKKVHTRESGCFTGFNNVGRLFHSTMLVSLLRRQPLLCNSLHLRNFNRCFFALVKCNRKWRNAVDLTSFNKMPGKVNAKVDSYEQMFLYHNVRYLTHLSMSLKNVQNLRKNVCNVELVDALNWKMAKWIVFITQNTYHSFEIVDVM